MSKRTGPKETKNRVPYTPERVLTDWRTLISAMPHMSEEEITTALDYERDNCNRKDFVKRLYGRFESQRRKRELKEMNYEA